MIILDTNAVSEPLRNSPDMRVEAWIARQPVDAIFVTAITIAEMLAGIAVMPDGRRKELMASRTETVLTRLFGDRILVFDAAAARSYSSVFGAMRTRGRAISEFDCQIAAIAIANGMTIATRDTQPFLEAGVPVVNPWAG